MSKPKANLRNLRIVELSGVDRPCHEPALVALMKRAPGDPPQKVVKHSLATDEVEGHAHAIRIYEDGTMWVAQATMAGSEHSHGHGIVTNADGSLSILPDSGHTHQIVGAAVVSVPADAVVVVQASAAPTRNTANASSSQAKSTRTTEASKGRDKMKTIVLTEAQHAHYSKLNGEEAEAFLAKSFAERDAVLADIAKNDPVVYKTAAGVEIRKSHGDVALMLAKQADESAAQIAKQNEAIAKRDEEIEKAEVAKATTALFKGKVPGSDEAQQDIVRSLRKSGLPAERIDAMFKALTGLVNVSPIGKSAAGENAGQDPVDETAVDKLDALTQKHMAAHNVDRPTARVAVLKTAEGKRLYAESIGRA